MKLATLGTEGTSFGVRGEVAVTVDNNATAFYGMISGLAEDKIAYPIREIASNAWDAARGEVYVTLPTPLNPVFSVRDNGPGLSHDFMLELFTKMYHSDKRDDPTKLGGWGLGRFSPFAYLLSSEKTGFYMIVSWHNGVRTDYVMDIGGDGRPTLKTMGYSESNEPSGLMVTFSVLKKDIDAFKDRAKKIFWSFEPRPHVTPELDFAPCPPILTGSNWKLLPSSAPFNGPHVRIGCVMYPIDLNREGLVNPENFVNSQTKILFEAEINTVQPTLSREDLAYDHRTIQTLNSLINTYYEESRMILQERMDVATNYFGAAKILKDSVAHLHPDVRGRIYLAVNWRGFSIPLTMSSDHTARFMILDTGWTKETTKRFEGSTFNPGNVGANTPIVLETSPEMSFEKLHAAGMTGRRLLWVRCAAGAREATMLSIGNPEGVIHLKDFTVEGAAASRPKNIRKRSFLDVANGPRYNQPPNVTREINLEEPHVYIRIDKSNRYSPTFKCLNDRPVALETFYSLASLAMTSGCLTRPFYVLPVSPVEGEFDPPENWMEATKMIVDRLKAHHQTNHGDDESWAMYYHGDFPDQITILRSLPQIPFQKIGGDLGEFYAWAWAGIRQVNTAYRNSGRMTYSQLLSAVGDTSVKDDEGLSIPQKVKRSLDVLNKKYKLMPALSQEPFRVRHNSPSPLGSAFAEYERLLMNQKGFKAQVKEPELVVELDKDESTGETIMG